MDELAEAISGFGVTKTLNDPNSPHPRYSQYKQKTGTDQNERRKRILESQKDRRFNAKILIRALNENNWDNVIEYGDEEESAMDTDQVKPKHPGRHYRNQLMLSEWMIEVPENFVEEWLMVACPVGKRCLVLAGNGYSSAYAKSGHYLMRTFQSHLPGGCGSSTGKSESAILDCIYSDVTRTFYILDIMGWNDMEVYNSDVEFRLFWLHAKLNEWEEDLTILSKRNEFRFVPLRFQPCDDLTIKHILDEWLPQELDGLLFYHKRVHYLFGANPLCLWLQAYMLPDLLKIPVSDAHMQRAPQKYVNFQHHTNEVKAKKEKMEVKERQWRQKKAKKSTESVKSIEMEESSYETKMNSAERGSSSRKKKIKKIQNVDENGCG